MRVRGAARPGCAGAKQASPAFAACGGGAAPRTLPLQKRCKGSRGRPAEPGKIRQFILSNYYNAAAPEKQRNRRFCNRIVKMPRPPPPQNPHPRRRALNPQSSAPLRRSPAPCKSFAPPPANPRKKSGNLCREPCPVTTAPQKGKTFASAGNPPPPHRQPPQKIRQFAPGDLSRYNSAAKRKNLCIRREPTPRHQPPQKIPAICAGSLVPLQQRRKKENPSHPPGTPPPPTPAKRSRGEKSPHPPGPPHRPTPAKKSGRLPRSATFPLFKRRKMRYTGKEIHPDTEDET